MRALQTTVQQAFWSFWRGLRQWCGDSAYEVYLARANRGEGCKVLSPTEFYVERLNHKYSRPNRCC